MRAPLALLTFVVAACSEQPTRSGLDRGPGSDRAVDQRGSDRSADDTRTVVVDALKPGSEGMVDALSPDRRADSLVPELVAVPQASNAALRNPLKGFRPNLGEWNHPYGSLFRHYIKWNQIENHASDGIDKIRDFCNAAWKDLPVKNGKVIPRVYLDWPGVGTYWPADLTTGDYSSATFIARLERLIARLGQLWDDDPRVAFVQTGLIGQWGEQHSPQPTLALQQTMGDAFKKAFKNKLLENRYPKQFTAYGWGIYWDSFGCDQNADMKALGRWKLVPYEGEIAYNYCTPAGKTPEEDVTSPTNQTKIEGLIREFHTTALGWISSAPYNPTTAQGIDRLQRAFGYRFVIEEARYPAALKPGAPFTVKLKVRNLGSAPFYYPWPLELSLLDPATRKVVWKQQASGIDLRKWLPGDSWDDASGAYKTPAAAYAETAQLTLASTVPAGEYLLAVAVLDPAGSLPSLRFAITAYVNGGRHPLGRVGVGAAVASPDLTGLTFDDPAKDTSLHYLVP